MTEENNLENLDWYEKTEEEEPSGSFKEYEITASPNDFNVNTIYDFIVSGVVEIPGFQRNYVWDKKRASKLIESIIIGIPIPQLFLYEQAKNKYLVIDGHQRLMTIYYFKKKRFPHKEARAKLRRIFNEKGEIADNILYDNNYFSDFNLDLFDKTTGKKSKLHDLNYSTLDEYKSSFDLRAIRNIFIKQMLPPDDDSSIYELFNRLNTGGVNLKPQEIRASLYHSEFYKLLNAINLEPQWRKLLALEEPDLNMKDVEMLLRGFAMLLEGDSYTQPMVRFLNTFSRNAATLKPEMIPHLKELFSSFIVACSDLEENAFTLKKKQFNALIYEAVFTAVCKPYLGKPAPIIIPKLTKEKLNTLKNDNDFLSATQLETARKTNVDMRLQRAMQILGNE